jgi:serine/threonine protein kinase
MGLLGIGGFGRVYRARLEGRRGFNRDVAIKLLNDAYPGATVLGRFRDEARILGLLRDRAIVTVEPPTRLGTSWAVVMELADGQSARRLLDMGPLPPGAAVEVVAEIARALHNAWSQLGPDGEPIRLLHRDIKPDNIHISASGEVKLLDFGIAKANFGAREHKTEGSIGGTPGYIAPERVLGLDGPEADIYSLGVLLYELVSGTHHLTSTPLARNRTDPIPLPPAAEPALALAARMMDGDPDARPPARDVERLCHEIRRTQSGPLLRDWAEESVLTVPPATNDELVGTVLVENNEETPFPMDRVARTLGQEGRAVESLTQSQLLSNSMDLELETEPIQPKRGWPVWVGVVVSLAALLLIAIWWPGAPAQPDPSAVRPEVIDALAPEHKAPPVEPKAPSPAPEAEPSTASEPAPAAAPRMFAPPAPPPEPASTAVPAETLPISVSSIPLGLGVYLDGRRVGQTPLRLPMTVGDHELRAGEEASDSTVVRVRRRAPTRYIFREAEGRWESGY